MKVSTKSTTTSKLSAPRSIGFRPGVKLRTQIEMLSDELSCPGAKVTISAIVRDGMEAFWPKIRAYLRARARKRAKPGRGSHLIGA